MNRDEAKFILRCHQTNGKAGEDALIAEALDMMKRDPELARWFAEEQAVDSRLARKFGEFPVPPELKAQLLAARKVVAVSFWRRERAWLMAAAAVVILLGIVFLARPRRDGPVVAREQQEEILRLVERRPHIDVKVAGLPEVQTWLRERNWPAELALPDALKQQRYHGCGIVEWRGRRVALICLGVEGKHVDLFVFDQPSSAKTGNQPQFAQVGDTATAAWTRGGQTYLLAGKVDPQILKRSL
ncbi:MAG: hypothetical protein AB1705_27010 [Verrucomicrobiota bacterium]